MDRLFITHVSGEQSEHRARVWIDCSIAGEVDPAMVAALRGAVIVFRVDDAGNLIGAIHGGSVEVDSMVKATDVEAENVALASALIGFVVDGTDIADRFSRVLRAAGGSLTVEHLPPGRCRIAWQAIRAVVAARRWPLDLAAVIAELEGANDGKSSDAARWLRLSTPDRPRGCSYDDMPAVVAAMLEGPHP